MMFYTKRQFKGKKKKWERVKIERFNEGENFTILEVGCKYENLDCFVGMRPNPMDDLTLRVLHRGLSDIRNDLIQKKQETLNRLQSWKTRAQQMLKRRPIRFSQQLSGQREKVEDVNKKIRALQRLEFPEIIVLSRDQYADFESAN